MLRAPFIIAAVAALALAVFAVSALAQDKTEKTGAAKAETPAAAGGPAPRRFETRDNVVVGGRTISYRTIAGETFIKDEKGKPTASIFSTTYMLAKPDDPRTRPVAFIFNGGPGSASLWLHLGVFGPTRVKLPEGPDGGTADDGAAPYNLIDNPHTVLDVADLVFIDPVGTGWSRALGDAEPKQFWGVTEDAQSLREFIRLWLTEHKRWNSPKYLMGESYGTTRSAALINELEGGLTDIAVNGVVLVSTILNFGLDATDPGNDIGYVGLLPTYAATAWYHGKVDRAAWDGSLEKFLEAARAFAVEDYLPTLVLGQGAGAERRRDIAARLAGFIGLEASYLERAHLRVPLQRFMRELRRSEGLSVGRLDSRFTGAEPDTIGEDPEFDPSFYGIDAGYTAAMLDYFTRDLKVEIDDRYTTIGGVGGWNWKTARAGGDNAYLNVAPYLERAMRQNKDLRILAANGYYDLATPFFGTEMTLAQPGFDASRITLTYYEAGHMMYIHDPSLEKLAADVRAFISQAER